MNRDFSPPPPLNQFNDVVVTPQSFAYNDLIGQDKWIAWTPVRTGWVDVATPTVTGRYKAVGKQGVLQVKVVPGTTIATTAGTSYIGLPITAAGLAGAVTMYNGTTNIAVGTGGVDVANSRAYLPTQAPSGNTFTIWATWEI